MWNIVLFVLGAAFGSFLNVVALRYDPERFLFAPATGRSRCPRCKASLRWFELVPLLSFLAQRGRCRACKAPISLRYPFVELLSGLLFVFIPFALPHFYALRTTHYALSALWIAAFAALLLMSLIDIQWYLIPDEIHFILAACGIAAVALGNPTGLAGTSFLPDYTLLFRPAFLANAWMSHAAGAAFGAVFFLLLVLATRGRGMGWGDVKLAGALGFLFGWPDILFLIVFAFIAGSFYGIAAMLRGRKDLKSAVPFGPFLALGGLIVVFWGNDVLRGYFGLFGG